MARARNIKPGFFDNEILGELPPLTRLLFIGLWCLADKEGRLEDRHKRIKKELLGYDDVTAADVDAMLQTLHEHDFIQRYRVNDKNYIQVTNFLKHQNPHCKEQESVIPAPPGEDMDLDVVATEDHVKGRTETAASDCSQDLQTYQTGYEEESAENILARCKHSASMVQAPEKHSTCPADSLIPDSGFSDSINTTTSAAGQPAGKKAKKQESSPDRKTAKTPLEVGFCDFWDAFPTVRKQAKYACWKKWRIIQPDKAMVAQMLCAIEAGKQTRAWKQGYAPAPLTWLNQRRWEDGVEQERADEEQKHPETGSKNRFNNFSQRSYDFDEYEKMLLAKQ